MAVHRRPQTLRARFVGKALAGLAVSLGLASCTAHVETPNNAHVCNLYARGASHAEVLARGTVVALLGTSQGRSGTHEGFLYKLDGSCDLLLRVETNTSITGPLPLRVGAPVVVKGVYDTDVTGGVIHWTHHDPGGRHVAGYVEIGNKLYQ
jgi:hypothetical protein